MNKIRHDVYTFLAVLFTAMSLALCYFVYDAAYEDVTWHESEEETPQVVQTLEPLPDWEEIKEVSSNDNGKEPEVEVTKSAEPEEDFDANALRIIIDAGHGGKDHGSIGVAKRLMESKVDLKAAKMLYDMIEADEELKSLGISAHLIRDEDVSVDDQDRVYEASQGGSFFVSLHCASTSSGRKSDMSGAVVKYKAAQRDGSYELAANIVSNLREAKVNVRGPVVGDDEYILRNSSIPAVLVEMGYLTSDEDCKNLSSDKYLGSVVKAIFMEVKNESLARNGE